MVFSDYTCIRVSLRCEVLALKNLGHVHIPRTTPSDDMLRQMMGTFHDEVLLLVSYCALQYSLVEKSNSPYQIMCIGRIF